MIKVAFTKIALKVRGDVTKVLLHFTEPTEAGHQKHDIESDDAPLDSFLRAVRNLDRFVGLLCDFPKGYAEGCKVHTVSISHHEEKTGVILSVKKDLTTVGKSFNFNTPQFRESDEEASTAMPEEMLAAVKALIGEANRYRCGERSQIAMDLPPTEETESTPPDDD